VFAVSVLLQLRRSFDALDHDHDGFITSADLLNLQQQLLGEHHITKELAEEMMSEVSSCIDESHDGKMNYQEVGAMARCMVLAGCMCVRTALNDELGGAVAFKSGVLW
jgi:hypothetical protein